MSDSESRSEEVFDVERVRLLVDLMKQHDLSEIDLQNADRRIRLRRGQPNAPTYFAAPGAMPQAFATPGMPPAASSPASGGPAPSAPAEDNFLVVRSPMVGSVYLKPNPKAQPYVKAGDRVSPETVVCQIEAMKTYSEIPAGVSGVVVQVMVSDSEAVDVGKPLLKVDPGR